MLKRRIGFYLFSIPILWSLIWALAQLGMRWSVMAGSASAIQAAYIVLLVISAALLAAWIATSFVILQHFGRADRPLLNAKHSSTAARLLPIAPALCGAASAGIYRLSKMVEIPGGEVPALFLAALSILTLKLWFDRSVPSELSNGSRDHVAARRHTPERFSSVIPILILTAGVFLLFGRALFDPTRIVYGHDLRKQFYGYEFLTRAALGAGHLPFWNPYIYAGSPALGQPQYLALYPPLMLLRWLPLNLSLSWCIALHVWLGGIGMYTLARKQRLPVLAALSAALAYAFNGQGLLRIYAGHIWLQFALAWLPVTWLWLMDALKSGRALHTVLAAIGLAMIILTGHPAFPMYIAILLGLYTLYTALNEQPGSQSLVAYLKKLWSPALRFTAVVILALMLTAVQLLPTAVLQSQTSLSEGYEWAGINLFAVSMPDLLALFIPGLYVTAEKTAHQWELVPYFGVFFTLMVPFAFTSRNRRRFDGFLIAVVGLGLLFAFGATVGILTSAQILVPPLRMARIPPRALILWMPTLALLGGRGLSHILSNNITLKRISAFGQIVTFMAWFSLGCAIGHYASQPAALPEATVSMWPGLSIPVAGLMIAGIQAMLSITQPRNRRLERLLLNAVAPIALGLVTGFTILPTSPLRVVQLLFLSAMLALSPAVLRRLYQRPHDLRTLGLVLLIIGLDLYASARPYVSTETTPRLNAPELEAIAQYKPPTFDRVMAIDHPNLYTLHRISNIDAYNSAILGPYSTYVRAMTSEPADNTTRLLSWTSEVDPRALDFLGVRHIITAEPAVIDIFRSAVSDSEYRVSVNPDPLPRAFLVYQAQVISDTQKAIQELSKPDFDYASAVILTEPPDPPLLGSGSGSVDVVQFTEHDGALLMAVTTTDNTILVLSEPYYSERTAWVDGERKPLLQANVGFCAISVPAGTHTVELRYTPTSFWIGGSVTLVAIAGAAVAVGWDLNRHTRKVARAGTSSPET